MNAGEALTLTMRHLESEGWADFENMSSTPIRSFGVPKWYVRGIGWRDGHGFDISVVATRVNQDVSLGPVTINTDPFKGL